MLHPLKSADYTSEVLYKKGFLSSGEKMEIQATLTKELKKRTLCNFLTAKGASSLLKISEILSLEYQMQCNRESGSDVITTSSSSASSSSTEASVSSSGGSGDGEGEGGHRQWGKEEVSETAGLRQGQDDAEYFQGNLLWYPTIDIEPEGLTVLNWGNVVLVEYHIGLISAYAYCLD